MTKREKILQAGVKLFAKGSYNSVGIREIAREAGVNSAMISYYFKGKSGLMREIFAAFAGHMSAVNAFSLQTATSLEELVELSVHAFLDVAREHRELFMIGLRLLNSETDFIDDLRLDLHAKSQARFAAFLEKMGGAGPLGDDDGKMMFTAVLGTIYSDYLMGGGQYIDDDASKDRYAAIIINMLKPAIKNLFG